MTGMGGRLPTIAATALLGLGLAGCTQPHDEDVRRVASAFYEAYAARDGASTCAHLAPRTRSELEQSAGKRCATAVLEEEVPKVSEPVDVQVFGTQAEVKWNGETTFLARFQSGWKVMAAVCKPQPGRPYDCTISGG
jgi:hypothetical protein